MTTSPPVWAKLIKSEWEQKFFLKTEKDIRQAILGWFGFVGLLGLQRPLEKNYHGKEVATLEKYFVTMAQALSNGYKIELPPVEYSAQDAIKKIR